MSRRTKRVAVVLALVFAGVVLLVFSRPREPRYEGRSLTYWATRLNQPEAQRALTAIGTNALPFLIDWLDEEPTRLDMWTSRIIDRLPASLRPNPWPFGSRRHIADQALGFLGTNAIPAIPDLIRTFDWDWGGGSPYDQYALAAIGPAAIPALMRALEEDGERVQHVVSTLVYMSRPGWEGPRTTEEMRQIVAAMEQILTHPAKAVRLPAASRLMLLHRGEIHEEICDVWAKLLRDESSEVRAAAVEGAVRLPPGSPQLELLVPLRDDPHPSVRAAVERVLQKAGRLGPMPEPVSHPSEP